MNQTARLSLVVPTYRRQHCAIRTMEFWSGQPVIVHVLDGSDRPIDLDTLRRFHSNIRYHHIPIAVSERLARATELIDTEYVAMLGDDEFFLPSALAACVAELDRDPALVSCMGRCLGFAVEGDLVLGWPAYPEMADYTVLQDDPVERMVHHMNPYACSTVYSVVRSAAWRTAVEILPKTQIDVLSLEEIQFELAIAHQGRSRVLPILQWLRNYQEASVNDSQAQAGAKAPTTFVNWWRDEFKEGERDMVLEVFSAAMAKGDLSQVQTVRHGAKRALEVFYEYSISRALSLSQPYRPTTYTGRLRLVIRSCIPLQLAARLGAFRGAISDRSRPRPRLLSAAKNLEATGVRIDMAQLTSIGKLILDFYAPAKERVPA